jgi:hypothetical protein
VSADVDDDIADGHPDMENSSRLLKWADSCKLLQQNVEGEKKEGKELNLNGFIKREKWPLLKMMHSDTQMVLFCVFEFEILVISVRLTQECNSHNQDIWITVNGKMVLVLYKSDLQCALQECINCAHHDLPYYGLVILLSWSVRWYFLTLP